MENTTLAIAGNAEPAVVKINVPALYRPKRNRTQLAARRARKALEASKEQGAKVVPIKQEPPLSIPVPVKKDIPGQKRAIKGIERRIKAARLSLRMLHEKLNKIADTCGIAADVFVERDKVAPPHIIIRCVSEHFGIPPHMIRSERRDHNIVFARHVAYFLCDETGRAVLTIGRHFGRDHSTVIHGSTKIKEALKDNPKLAADLDAIRAKIKAAL